MRVKSSQGTDVIGDEKTMKGERIEARATLVRGLTAREERSEG